MATHVEIRGKGGRLVDTFPKYEGIIFPSTVKDPVMQLDTVRKFSYKEDDLFVCSYPKTGRRKCRTNWLLDMAAMLRNGNTEVTMGISPPIEVPVFLDAFYNLKPQPRIIMSHMPYRLLPVEHKQQNGKIILVVRNPKDTAVSTYHFAQKLKTDYTAVDWDEMLDLFITGNVLFNGYLEYYESWDKELKSNPDLHVFVAKYEDFKKDCLGNLRKLCHFLELDRSEEFLQEVVAANDVQKIKKAKEADKSLAPMANHIFKDGSMAFYRKGIVGDWKNMFTVAQNERFDREFITKKDTFFHYDYSSE